MKDRNELTILVALALCFAAMVLSCLGPQPHLAP